TAFGLYAVRRTLTQKVTMTSRMQPFNPELWKIKDNSPNALTIVSAPLESGTYDEYTLDPAFQFLPVRWTRYWKGDPGYTATLHYKPTGLRPELVGFKLRRYDSPGVVSCEYSVKITETARPDSIPDSQFKVEPIPGMIVIDMQSDRLAYRLAGNDAVEAFSLEEINKFVSLQRSRSWIGVFIVGAVGLLLTSLYFVNRLRHTRRS
ncbi:MAG: hypothetical protein K8R36_00425, partial [Planctomycetales bacterium]|nr:hypothetical protein [Planctomycetales bacterium]